VDAAYRLHKDLGPGLLESVYEAVLAKMLQKKGLKAERQKKVQFDFDGIHFDEGLRIDLLVADCLVIELKSLETIAPLHRKQLLTYLRLMDLRLGLVINFGAATFTEGIRRVVNNHRDLAASKLRINREAAPSSSIAQTRWRTVTMPRSNPFASSPFAPSRDPIGVLA